MVELHNTCIAIIDHTYSIRSHYAAHRLHVDGQCSTQSGDFVGRPHHCYSRPTFSTGYLAYRDYGEIFGPLPDTTTVALTLRTPFAPGEAPLSLPLTVSAYSSVHTGFLVPATAPPGRYVVALETTQPGPHANAETQAVVTITVADPRPPTAELVIDAPGTVAPGGVLVVALNATSFLGTNVANAEVELTWKRKPDQTVYIPTDEQAAVGATSIDVAGTVAVVTDAKGEATAEIDLAPYQQYLPAG